MTTPEKIQGVLGAFMTAVGVAGTLAPGRFGVAAGDGENTHAGEYSTQLWTLREAALGLMLLISRKSAHRRRFLGATVGLALAEVAVGLRSPALKGRDQVSAVAAPLAFAGVGTYALLADRHSPAR